MHRATACACCAFVLAVNQFAHATRVAVIGDYGVDNANEAAVATRVAAQNPDFLTTVGDNNYLTGSVADWDRTQGKYYGNYIKYPAGSQSQYANNGVATNKFFPTLGN